MPLFKDVPPSDLLKVPVSGGTGWGWSLQCIGLLDTHPAASEPSGFPLGPPASQLCLLPLTPHLWNQSLTLFLPQSSKRHFVALTKLRGFFLPGISQKSLPTGIAKPSAHHFPQLPFSPPVLVSLLLL